MSYNSWPVSSLGQQVTLQRGYDINKTEQTFGKVPVISSGGIKSWHNKAKESGPGVLLGRKGSIGTVYYTEKNYWPHSTTLFVKDFHGNNPRFVYYFFLSILEKIKNLDVGTSNPTLNRNHLHPMEVSWPDKEIQTSIVNILSALDRKIELNQRINDNLEQQASALIEKYFEGTDTLTMLSEIMSFENGFAFQSKTYLPTGQYRIITIKNVQDGRINPQDAVCINDLPAKMKPGCILHTGDVLLSLTGNVGRVGIVCEDNLLLNQRVAKIVPNENALLPFLYFVFRYPSIKVQMESIAKGTAQLNLSPVETLGLGIPYQRESAHQLAGRLFPLYCLIIKNSQENLALATTRDTLLPKLMSGEIDLWEAQ